MLRGHAQTTYPVEGGGGVSQKKQLSPKLPQI